MSRDLGMIIKLQVYGRGSLGILETQVLGLYGKRVQGLGNDSVGVGMGLIVMQKGVVASMGNKFWIRMDLGFYHFPKCQIFLGTKTTKTNVIQECKEVENSCDLLGRRGNKILFQFLENLEAFWCSELVAWKSCAYFI